MKPYARYALALAALLPMLGHSAFGQSARKTLVVAVVADYPPLEFKDPGSGRLEGFDVALGNALGKEMGMQVKWQETSFEQMMSAIATGRVDMALSGVGDTAPRREQVDFVDYMISGTQIYTQAANSHRYQTILDLCGKKVGANRRGAFPHSIQVWSDEHCKAAGKPPIDIVGTDGSVDARLQLTQGRVDAAAQGRETFPYLLNRQPNTFALVGKPIAPMYNGIAVAKHNTALRDQVAAALQRLIDKGIYKEIAHQYGEDANQVSKPGIDAAMAIGS